jgi:hypothetical protein
MELEKFITLRPYLYHLTDEANIESILNSRVLKSAKRLCEEAAIENAEDILRTRRIGHLEISGKNINAKLRDQDPLFQKIVEKNLDGGWSFSDFVYSLNSRVFFWSTIKDLRIHYQRYENQNEYPVIIRAETREVIAINKFQPQFCRLNSGAPRCSSYYVEGAPPRGPKTFQEAPFYNGAPSSVREVTFLDHCKLPSKLSVAKYINADFERCL